MATTRDIGDMAAWGQVRARWRRLSMGVSTLVGRPRGFFAPYRYAASVAAPGGYPEIEARFAEVHDAPASRALRVPADVVESLSVNAAVLSSFAGPAPEPRWDQSWYPGLDGAAAYAIVRAARPKRIVEVGSGHSTRFLVRAVRDGGFGTETLCIDPAPRAALDGLPVTWRRRVLSEADLPAFDALGPDDIGFFDSSHLLWPGTDVDMMLNRILPRLAPGVLVHVHDIFLPDAYPERWAWRGYTEQLGLGGWLMGGAFALLWSSRYVRTRKEAVLPREVAGVPVPSGAVETALWMRRV